MGLIQLLPVPLADCRGHSFGCPNPEGRKHGSTRNKSGTGLSLWVARPSRVIDPSSDRKFLDEALDNGGNRVQWWKLFSVWGYSGNIGDTKLRDSDQKNPLNHLDNQLRRSTDLHFDTLSACSRLEVHPGMSLHEFDAFQFDSSYAVNVDTAGLERHSGASKDAMAGFDNGFRSTIPVWWPPSM
ncbi:hypothetical protein NMY22_g8022 [Coprinellus aureogranulatus]|nr:hypothetical protein NMY22_g8022 [Coprinellus aureogranulatus]